MHTTHHIAKLFRDVHYGGNWTWVNLKDTLEGVTWQQATTQVHGFNTIATLVFHMNFYIHIAEKVIMGHPLSDRDRDKYAFACPPILSQADWEKFLEKIWADADSFATMIEQLPDDKLDDIFIEAKYGNYYRNLHGIIEHYHYHLGQIVLIKKILSKEI